MLAEESIDVVHINSPIGDHGWMSIAALKAGKNVMRWVLARPAIYTLVVVQLDAVVRQVRPRRGGRSRQPRRPGVPARSG
jgi:hypothetical protein